MHRLCAIILACVLPTISSAHEMIPTYPELKPAYIEGVRVTSLRLFNHREDVRFYEIGVFTENWEPVKFATESPILEVNYREGKSFDVYIREKDKDRVTYICTRSKLEKQNIGASAISSRICSKIKK